jgi:hypothetical protein
VQIFSRDPAHGWPKILGLTPGELTWFVVGVALLAYELWAVATRGGDVLTRAMRANTPRWTAIPVGLGGLMGHLTGPKLALPPYAWVLPFLLLAAALTRDALVGGRIPENLVTYLFLIGYATGVFWVGSP